MSTAIGLETLRFEFPGSKTLPAFAPVLVGVIGSGNLEILLEDVGGKKCSFEVQTSARGFGQIGRFAAAKLQCDRVFFCAEIQVTRSVPVYQCACGHHLGVKQCAT